MLFINCWSTARYQITQINSYFTESLMGNTDGKQFENKIFLSENKKYKKKKI